MKRTLLTGVLIVTLNQIGFAQNFDKSKLDIYFNALETNNKFMGSVAISKDGAIIYSKAIGFSDIENNLKANENSEYRIGSVSKTFTSVLVLKAVEKGKLDLNQTIDKYFPTIENARKVTIKLLLSHRSGIHNFTDDKDYPTWKTQPKTEKEMVAIITKGGSDFEPDSKAAYSNSNFVLLTYILQKSFNQSYAKLIQEYIVKPAGLQNTHFGGKIEANKNECKSYIFKDGWKLESETDLSIPLGAGGMVSTPSALVKFSNALFNGKLLKAESLEIMKTIKDGYGNGLFQVPFDDKKGYGHTGGIDGFSSVFSYFSDGNISYAFISNGTNYNNNNISIAILRAVYDKPYDIPNFTTYKVSSEDLDKYLGTYASKQIPLKIAISKNNMTLIAQTTGQPAYSLDAIEKDKFTFDLAGVVLEFNPTEKTMVLKLNGAQYIFTKE